MRHLRLTAFLALTVYVAGCASAPAPQPVEPLVEVTHKEFAENVAMPILQLMTAISAFHAANHQISTDRETLAVFAAAKGAPVMWERFSRFEMSNTPEESTLRITITSPSSLNETGEIRTSWRLFFMEDAATPKKLHVLISPESSFCLSHSPDLPAGERTKIELFLALLARYRPVAWAKQTPLCFKYSRGKPSGSSDQLRRKLDEMRQKQLQRNSSSSSARESIRFTGFVLRSLGSRLRGNDGL